MTPEPSRESAVDEQLPRAELQEAIEQGAARVVFQAKAKVEPHVAGEVAAALSLAADGAWKGKQFAEAAGWKESVSSCARDFFLAVWPSIGRLVHTGQLEQHITPRPKDAKNPVNDVSFFIDTSNGLTMTIDSQNWRCVMSFAADEKNPEPALFARLLEQREKARSK